MVLLSGVYTGVKNLRKVHFTDAQRECPPQIARKPHSQSATRRLFSIENNNFDFIKSSSHKKGKLRFFLKTDFLKVNMDEVRDECYR